MNLLHDIPAGDPKKEVNIIIEIPMGGGIKYEFDKDKQVIAADRFLYTAFRYPFNYGFIPSTWAGDDDPLDIVVLSSESISTGTLIECRVIGLLQAEDEEGEDTKVIAVPKAKVDPAFANINDTADIPDYLKDKLRHFFENYKSIEPGKWVKITGWVGKEEAIKVVEEAILRYQKRFPPSTP